MEQSARSLRGTLVFKINLSCFFDFVSGDLKSFDMQTISARIKLNSGVFELALFSIDHH